MLRIHFTRGRPERVRIAERPEPLWEVLLSLHTLQADYGEDVFGPWRATMRARMSRSDRALARLAPPRGYSPDFLTPTAEPGKLRDGLSRIAATPKERLEYDLLKLAAGRSMPEWMRDLARADRAALRRMSDAIGGYHAMAVAPFERRLTEEVEAEVLAPEAGPSGEDGDVGTDGTAGGVVCAGAVADVGRAAEPLLNVPAIAVPHLRWRPPVLEVDYPVDQELHLRGRDLTFVPSLYCWTKPISLFDPLLPPIVVFPVSHRAVSASARRSPQAVAKLLGRTRAAVLQATARSVTTTELARAVGISVASASEHAAVLRDTGLVTSRRDRNAVRHSLTDLGAELLRGGGPGSDRRTVLEPVRE